MNSQAASPIKQKKGGINHENKGDGDTKWQMAKIHLQASFSY